MARNSGTGFYGLCCLGVFLGAALVLLAEVTFTSALLPWFGGAPDVWSVCFCFCQLFALGGALYAWGIARLLSPLAQCTLHAILVGGAVLFLLQLPLLPDHTWQPHEIEYPALHILKVLLAYLAVPVALLSATLPLVHGWMTARLGDRATYRWQSWSAAATCIAIVCFLMVIEPLFPCRTQAGLWRAGLGSFALVLALIAVTLRAGEHESLLTVAPLEPDDSRFHWDDIDDDEDSPKPLSPGLRWLLWIMLPAYSVVLTLGIIGHFSAALPAAPFLWLTPLLFQQLAVFLSFDHEKWYSRRWCGVGLMLTVLGVSGNAANHVLQNPLIEMAGYYSMLSFACLICYGELALIKPAAGETKSFFLAMNFGNVLGSALVALVCPLIFKGYIELSLAALLAFMFGALVLSFDRQLFGGGQARLARMVLLLVAGGTLVVVALNYFQAHRDPWDVVEAHRNFYGSVYVYTPSALLDAKTDREPTADERRRHDSVRILFDGGRLHGYQDQLALADSSLAATAITNVYGTETGVGRVLDFYRSKSSRKIGVIGLATGGLAEFVSGPYDSSSRPAPRASAGGTDEAPADPLELPPDETGATDPSETTKLPVGDVSQARDQIIFYEINPTVVSFALRRFGYLQSPAKTPLGEDQSESLPLSHAGITRRGAQWRIVTGDPRLQLEHGANQQFDVLVIDALRADVIPIHLLTREAFKVYLSNVKDDGAIVINCAAEHVDLISLVRQLTQETDRQATVIRTKVDDQATGARFSSNWIVVTKHPPLLEKLRSWGEDRPFRRLPPWTDDRSELTGFLK